MPSQSSQIAPISLFCRLDGCNFSRTRPHAPPLHLPGTLLVNGQCTCHTSASAAISSVAILHVACGVTSGNRIAWAAGVARNRCGVDGACVGRGNERETFASHGFRCRRIHAPPVGAGCDGIVVSSIW